jgi:hypothetical protein
MSVSFITVSIFTTVGSIKSRVSVLRQSRTAKPLLPMHTVNRALSCLHSTGISSKSEAKELTNGNSDVRLSKQNRDYVLTDFGFLEPPSRYIRSILVESRCQSINCLKIT